MKNVFNKIYAICCRKRGEEKQAASARPMPRARRGAVCAKRGMGILLTAALLLTSAGIPSPVYAEGQSGIVVTQYAGSTVKIRESATVNSNPLIEVPSGASVRVLASVTGQDGKAWYQIQYTNPANGAEVTGHMLAKYVKVSENASADPGTGESGMSASGSINANNVFVRQSAGRSGARMLSLYHGDKVNVVGQVTVSGEQWYHVTGTKNGTAFDGFTFSSYVTLAASVPDNSDYAQSLRNQGFPESYIQYLSALHSKYPSWVFEPVVTGLDWNTVIERESKNGINLVPSSYDDSKKSTASGAYDWMTNKWTVYDGNTWVSANPSYIAYYMDPRNFLDETNIFQFESLSFSGTHSVAGVQAIASGTFLANSVTDRDGATFTYPDVLFAIGQSTGVSPYLLTARVKQEQGGSGTSSLISGKYPGYEGYFNYFNFGASGSGKDTVIRTGLAYAKNKGWDTRYKSLAGGAALLGKNYIAKGQNTLYFQKFNVVYTAALYGHQYMGNVVAAYTEGRSMAAAYKDKNQPFTFRIPVYSNMPETAVSFASTGNPNNYLKSLAISGVSLTPSFSGAGTDYSAVVASGVSSVSVSATPVAGTSSVSGTGNYNLAPGNNTIQVKCKSQSGNVRTYTINLYRQGGESGNSGATPNPGSGGGYSVSSGAYAIGSYVTGIAPGTDAATFLGNILASNCTIKLLDASGNESAGAVGTGNRLAVYVDNNVVAQYEIVVYGDANGDGAINALDLIKINRHILGKSYLSGAYVAAADANKRGDGVNALDLIVTNNHILGKKQLSQ